MGVVYRALDPKIGREIALKTILTGVTPQSENYAELHRRLEREARAAGALNHPNIVTVYDVGEWEGAFFIAMEFVDGTPLDRIVKGGDPLPLEKINDLIKQIARALDYAHGKGVVHRDIKPANLILDGHGQIKVADFGVARLQSGSITQEGGRVGSPSYMSPEQIQAEEIDGRTDFFSLGVVFYQLLTGRKPFRGKNIAAITHAICNKEPIAPIKYNTQIPRRINQIVLKLLAKEREERYENGVELCNDLDALDQIDLSSVTLDYGAPPPREDTMRDRTPTPAPRNDIHTLFRNITSDVRGFSVGDPTGPRGRVVRPRRQQPSSKLSTGWIIALGAAAVGVAGLAYLLLG